MFKIFKRSKLFLVIVNIVLVALNKKLNLGMSEMDIASLAGASATYIAGESYIDAKNKK